MPEKEQKSSSKNSYPLITKSGYPLDEVVSALQKEIRRGNEVEALYWATEIVEGGFAKYLWRKLFIISQEDVSPEEYHIPPLIWSLYAMTKEEIEGTPSRTWKNPEVFHYAKAVFLLARAKKNRTIDYYTDVVSKRRKEGWFLEVEEYALDQHTSRGRKRLKDQGKNPDREFHAEGSKVTNYQPVEKDNYYRNETLRASGLEDLVKEGVAIGFVVKRR